MVRRGSLGQEAGRGQGQRSQDRLDHVTVALGADPFFASRSFTLSEDRKLAFTAGCHRYHLISLAEIHSRPLLELIEFVYS
jgi:hypothetical protein